MDQRAGPSPDWRVQRKAGMAAIAVATFVAAGIWLAIFYLGPGFDGMGSLSERMLFALKCVTVATLFCLVAGVEAVAHERLQSAAFDPLQRHESRRLRVNLRYLQNTLEQLIVFAVGVFGLAAYASGGSGMRAVLATTIVWILGRYAFWIGYHRSAALRGLGAPGMMASMLVLLYVVWRIGDELAGTVGGAALIGAFLAVELVLFRTTRERPEV
jgi:hypothetical protein